MRNSYFDRYLKQNLRTCQLKQLSILEETDRICRKHNIPYWLDGGSLLGAMRHGGFIPSTMTLTLPCARKIWNASSP